MILEGNAKKLYDLVSRTRGMADYEACDYILIPINIQQHWTTVIVDIWNKRIFHYDPMVKGIQNEMAIKLFKVLFDMLYKYRKTCDIQIGSKVF